MNLFVLYHHINIIIDTLGISCCETSFYCVANIKIELHYVGNVMMNTTVNPINILRYNYVVFTYYLTYFTLRMSVSKIIASQ